MSHHRLPNAHYLILFLGTEVTVLATQLLFGDDGNDDLDGGRDNDGMDGEGGRNKSLSGKGGDDCVRLSGDENERVSLGDGDDLIVAEDGNGDDVFCGAGHDTGALPTRGGPGGSQLRGACSVPTSPCRRLAPRQ